MQNITCTDGQTDKPHAKHKLHRWTNRQTPCQTQVTHPTNRQTQCPTEVTQLTNRQTQCQTKATHKATHNILNGINFAYILKATS